MFITLNACQSARKVTATKTTAQNALCAESWLSFPDQPHPMWEELPADNISFPAGAMVPRQYKAYRINADTLKAFFTSFHTATGDKGMVVPAGNDCEAFMMHTSGAMAGGLQQKYPDIVSLQGNGSNNKTADLRLDWDGTQFKGQLFYNSTVYFITPISGGKAGLVYIMYDQKESTDVKQPFEQAPPREEPRIKSQEILHDR